MTSVINNNNNNNKIKAKTYSATAPGKVILFGEHAVVYGVPAVACCLSGLRVQVDICIKTIESLYEEGPMFHINLENINKDMDDSNSIKISFPTTNFMDKTKITQRPISWSTVESSMPLGQILDVDLMKDIENMIITKSLTNPALKSNKGAANAFINLIYLATNILNIYQPPYDTKKSIFVNVRSLGLPIGAGLGSSAAFSVATAASLLSTRFSNIGGGDLDQSFGEMNVKISSSNEQDALDINENNSNSIIDNTYIPNKHMLELINSWAHIGEKIMHGNPSGLDNTISTFGGTLSFRKDLENSGKPIFSKIPNCPALRTLITNTKVPRETKVLVANVRKLREEKQEYVDNIWKGIDEIVNTFQNLVTDEEKMGKEDEYLYKAISSLFERNQNLLRNVGVSHPSLEIVCNHSKKFGFITKLTGAGGGGCAVTLLGIENVSTSGKDESNMKTKIKELMETLKIKEQFDCFECDIGGPGVRLNRVVVEEK